MDSKRRAESDRPEAIRPDAVILKGPIGPEERRTLRQILGGEGEAQISDVGEGSHFVTAGNTPPQTLLTTVTDPVPAQPRFRWTDGTNGWRFGYRITDVP